MAIQDCFSWLLLVAVCLWILYDLLPSRRATDYEPPYHTWEVTYQIRPPKPQTKGDTRTKRPYPLRLRGANSGETRRVRLYVQRDDNGLALYKGCVDNWNDETPRGVLADWLEERGFPGAAKNLREGVG